MFAEATAVDAAEDALLGDRRGDELPPELADATSRKARLVACREKLAAKAAETAARQQEKIDARAAEEQATCSADPLPPPGSRSFSRKLRNRH